MAGGMISMIGYGISVVLLAALIAGAAIYTNVKRRNSQKES